LERKRETVSVSPTGKKKAAKQTELVNERVAEKTEINRAWRKKGEGRKKRRKSYRLDRKRNRPERRLSAPALRRRKTSLSSMRPRYHQEKKGKEATAR